MRVFQNRPLESQVQARDQGICKAPDNHRTARENGKSEPHGRRIQTGHKIELRDEPTEKTARPYRRLNLEAAKKFAIRPC